MEIGKIHFWRNNNNEHKLMMLIGLNKYLLDLDGKSVSKRSIKNILNLFFKLKIAWKKIGDRLNKQHSV